MKRNFLLFGLIVLSFTAFSQVVIEELDIMQPGDTFLIHVDLNPTITVDLAPGANLTWDFTGLQNDESNFACYAPSDDLEFIGEFPQSEFYTYGPGFIYAGPGGGAPLDNWGYMMFYTNTNGLFVEGFYSDYGMGYRSTMNTPAELLMFTPANYLDEEINDSYWEVVVNENIMDYDTLYRRDVDKELVADAWGTLTTDYGTYEVLRVHETGISVDSVFGYIGSTTFFSMEVARDTINNYYFWAKELRNPLMTLHCDFDGNIERIDYLMGAIYAENKLTQIENLKVFPNPANDYFVIDNANGEIQILSIDGKLIKQLVSEGNQEVISTDSFSQGLYFIIVDNETKEKVIVY
jgi:hypothetical protein